MKYQAVIWDFDGTLASTSQDVWESVKYGAESCGGIISNDFIKKNTNLGMSMKEIFHAVEPYPGDEKFEQFKSENRKYYRTITSYPNTHLYPGIADILTWLMEKGVKSYIISLKPQKPLARILNIKQWSDYFESILSPDSIAYGEQTKAQLISFLIKDQKLDPKRVIYIGDTFSDVQAAKESRIKCIGVTYGDGDTKALISESPDYLIDRVEKIRKVLEET